MRGKCAHRLGSVLLHQVGCLANRSSSIDHIIDKHHRDPKVEARIYANKHFITDYIAGLEAILGRSVDEILKEDPDVPYAKGE